MKYMVFTKRISLVIFILLVTVTSSYAEDGHVLLVPADASPDQIPALSEGTDNRLNGSESTVLVTGLLTMPDLSITDPDSLVVTGEDGKAIPLILDKSSFYSEFDDSEINSLRVAFIYDPEKMECDTFQLAWGKGVSGNNKVVDELVFYRDSIGRYKVFSWEEPPVEESSATYNATVDVIVDDKADTYYLWYLTPLAIIFGLLILRRFSAK